MSDKLNTIPARYGVATLLRREQVLKVINTSGTQVVDFWAFKVRKTSTADAQTEELLEYLSVGHSRVQTLHLVPKVNDTLVSNIRSPLLTLIEDHSPGVHDTQIPACDPHRYRAAGIKNWKEHRSCAQNLVETLERFNDTTAATGLKPVGVGLKVQTVPPPLNLFMNIPWTDSGNIKFAGPVCEKGDYVRFRAEDEVVVVMSACPNDISGINGQGISDAHFIIEGIQ